MHTQPADLGPCVPLLPREPGPSDAEVRRVMTETGFDYLQARNHAKCRAMLRAMPQRRRVYE